MGKASYTVEFRSIRRGRLDRKTWVCAPGTDKLKSCVEMVFVDDLHKVIETGTGLYTRLF